MSESHDDVSAVRDMVAPLGPASLSELSSRRLRKRAMAAMEKATPRRLSRLAQTFRRLEPAIAFTVGAVYMSLALYAVIVAY